MTIPEILKQNVDVLNPEETDSVETLLIKQLLTKAVKGDNAALKIVADNIIFKEGNTSNEPIQIEIV